MERRGRDSRPGSIRTLIPHAEDAAGDGVTVYKNIYMAWALHFASTD
jgi:hypothetical protein